MAHRGLVQIEDAKLYTRPQVTPRIIGAAITPQTAEWLGGWADGLITVSHPISKLKEVVDAFRRGGGAKKPMILKMQISYDQTETEAQLGAHDQWRNNIFRNVLLTELKTTEQFDAAGEFVAPDELAPHVRISADPPQHVEWIQQYAALGFDEIILHNVNRQQERFIQVFGEKVLPALNVPALV